MRVRSPRPTSASSSTGQLQGGFGRRTWDELEVTKEPSTHCEQTSSGSWGGLGTNTSKTPGFIGLHRKSSFAFSMLSGCLRKLRLEALDLAGTGMGSTCHVLFQFTSQLTC